MNTIKALLAVLLVMGALGLSPSPVLSGDNETDSKTNVEIQLDLYQGD